MTNKNLDILSGAGVSIWLDDLSRERLKSGGLATLIAEIGRASCRERVYHPV